MAVTNETGIIQEGDTVSVDSRPALGNIPIVGGTPAGCAVGDPATFDCDLTARAPEATNVACVATETIIKPELLTANPAGHLKGEMNATEGLEFPETVEVLNSTRPGGKADIKNIDQDNDGTVHWTSKGKYPDLAQTLKFTRGDVEEEQTYKADGTR